MAEQQKTDANSKNMSSCTKNYTRKEFVQKVLKGAVLAGTVAAAPRVVDKFLVPPAHAASSTNPASDIISTTPNNDTINIITHTGD